MKQAKLEIPGAFDFLQKLEKSIDEHREKVLECIREGKPTPKPYFKARLKSWTAVYECEYYKCDAHPRGCLFCKHCTDVWFDYTNGPYMFLCDKHEGENDPTQQGIRGKCKMFEKEEGCKAEKSEG